MLHSLRISNYAIIDHLELNFSGQLTTVTGETGAGKSIIIGALSLILGQRADTSALFDKSRKCIIEGAFDVSAYGLDSLFDRNELDHEDVCVIRREISSQGKSRAFVNDTPVNLDVLRELGSNLVDLHRQHETLDLATDRFQLDVIDSIAGHGERVRQFGNTFRKYKLLQKELESLREQHLKAQNDLDYYTYQLKELDELNLQSGEQQQLEAELRSLSHAEEIAEVLSRSAFALTEGEGSLVAILGSVESDLRKVSAFDERIEALLKRIESSRLELDDVAREMQRLMESSDRDPSRVQMLTERLDLIYRLMKKHRAASEEELEKTRLELQEKVKNVSGLDDRITELEHELTGLHKKLSAEAQSLTKARTKAIARLTKEVEASLPSVGLPNAILKVQHDTTPEAFGPNGMDSIRFLFSANPGSDPVEIRRVASGGELSRLMLVVKSLIASTTALPTLVFDEIDEGVSGEVAKKVGNMLRDLAASHQVICITHLPQIAAKGHAHYYVYKEVKGSRTITFVKPLETRERVIEIAKMLSGEKPTSAALENAQELLTLN